MSIAGSAPRLWNPAIETMDIGEQRAMQLRLLQAQVQRVFEGSPYYRDKFTRAGVEPSQIKTLADVERLPFFDKDEERRSQEASREQFGHPFGLHITCSPQDVVRVSSSSGTTGSPTYTGYTEADRLVGYENVARLLRRIGVEQGEPVMHTMVLSMWIAGMPFAEGIAAYGAQLVPVGVLSGVERWAQVARDVRPGTILCTPSFAEHLIKVLPERAGLEPAELGVKRVLVCGEPGGSIPEVIKRIETGFGGARIYDLAGATGAHSPIAVSCEAQAGLHFLAHDSCLVEVVDPMTLEALPIEDGVEGEIVVTGLTKESAPLLRWREKDRVRIATAPCECGLPGFRLWLLGRTDDMLLVKGVNVYPAAVHDVVADFTPHVTGNMRIVKDSEAAVVEPPVRVKIETDAREDIPTNLAARIEDKIHHMLRFRAKVELVPAGSLGTSIGQTHKRILLEVAGAGEKSVS